MNILTIKKLQDISRDALKSYSIHVGDVVGEDYTDYRANVYRKSKYISYYIEQAIVNHLLVYGDHP